MFKILRKFDIFSIEPRFYIFNQSRVSSKTGTLLTLIQFLISTLMIVFTFETYFNSENFMTSFTQFTMQYYEYNQSEIPFFISIFDYNEQPVPLILLEKYLKFDVEYFSLLNITKPNIKINLFNLQLEKCNLTTNLRKYSHLVKEIINIDNYLCLPQTERDLKILGTFGDYKGFSQIKIKISKCLNTTQNNNICFDIENINKFIKNSLIVWGTIDYEIDHTIPEDPFVAKVITEGHYMTTQNLKSLKLKRKKISYTSDMGIFFNP